MNLLQEYDFDALPYLDREYDDPEQQRRVHELIAEEMRTFSPRDYLSTLPSFSLSSPLLASELSRVEKGVPMEKRDFLNCAVDPPQGALQKDVQAWRKAVMNAKIQYEHQKNRLMNLELLEEHGGSLWLQHNDAVDGMQRQVDGRVQGVKRKSDEINYQRKRDQEKAMPSIINMTTKRDQTLMKTWSIKQCCDNMINKRVKAE